MRAKNLEQQIGVRLTAEQIERLDRLALLTHRTRSQVIRVLVEAAEPAPERDLRLAGQIEARNVAA